VLPVVQTFKLPGKQIRNLQDLPSNQDVLFALFLSFMYKDFAIMIYAYGGTKIFNDLIRKDKGQSGHYQKEGHTMHEVYDAHNVRQSPVPQTNTKQEPIHC